MITLNDFPVELLTQIFGHLPLKYLDNCRLVCRRFMSICDGISITDLVYSNITSSYGSRKDYWQFTNEQFSYKNLIGDSYEITTGHKWTFRLEKLKRLYYHGGLENPCFWNRLVDLPQLVHLKLESNDYCFNGQRIIELNLPNLERLEINYVKQCELHLNTPKLSMLKCFEFETIRLADPTSVEHLELARYTETANQLVNVKYLKVNCNSIRHRQIWSVFRELQTLVCFSVDGLFNFYANIQTVRDLFLQKTPQQKLYFQSVELTQRNTICEYETSKNVLAFQIKNYGSLCTKIISHYEPLDYNELMRLTSDRLPTDFFRKFFGVRSVRIIGEVNNPDHLLWFLKQLVYLNHLQIDSSSVSQETYDQLQELDQLTSVTVTKNRSITNHDVLLKIPLLRTFFTDQNGAHFLDMAFDLFSRREIFATIHFYVRNENIRIHRDRGMYTFTRYKRTEDDGFKQLESPRNSMDLSDLQYVLQMYKLYLSTGEFRYRSNLH